MRRIPYRDGEYAIVVAGTYDGVRVVVCNECLLPNINSGKDSSFAEYRVSPPGKLSKMLYGSYESQIQSAVDSLVKDIKATHNSDAIKRKKSDGIIECTKETLVKMYGE